MSFSYILALVTVYTFIPMYTDDTTTEPDLVLDGLRASDTGTASTISGVPRESRGGYGS